MRHGNARLLLLACAFAAVPAGAADEPPDAELLEFLGALPAGDDSADDWFRVLDGLGGAADGDGAPAGPAPPTAPEGAGDEPPR